MQNKIPYGEWIPFLLSLLSGCDVADNLIDDYHVLLNATASEQALHKLIEHFDLSPFEHFAVLLSLTTELNEDLALAVGHARRVNHAACPNMALALQLFEQLDPLVDRVHALTSMNLGRLMRDKMCGMRTKLRLRPSALSLLCGKVPSLPGCSHKLYKHLPPLLCGEDTQQALAACLHGTNSHHPSIVLLTGDEGSGKRFHLQKLSEQAHVPLLLLDAEDVPESLEKFDDFLNTLHLELTLAPAMVCLRHYENKAHLQKCVTQLQSFAPFLVLSATDNIDLPVLDHAVYILSLQIKPLSRSERHRIWEIVLEREGMSLAFDIRSVCNQYKLTVGHIEQAVHSLKRAQDNGASVDEWALRAIIETASQSKLKGGLAKLLKPRFAWDDIILPEATKESLREICSRVKHEERVLEEWGFGNIYPYGIGLSVLFYGAPGTGKTMAAHVIASELKTPLLYVDFSNMLDKYIGETEKHIMELFRQAKQLSAVLFFDEADALFAKRSEVSDATDRYANAQTACLLQCIEEYDGVVILATNLLSNFDAAFKRRMRYYLHFFLPDQGLRVKLWERVFPKSVPLANDVNFTALAERELPAGSIKNIALTAAYLAAEDGELSIHHLNRALRVELMKDGQLPSLTQRFYGWG